MTRQKGRPAVEAERDAKGRIKYTPPLRVMLSSNKDESDRLKVVFEERLGRDGLLKLLNMPRNKFDELMEKVK
jgi:hypothetical protein